MNNDNLEEKNPYTPPTARITTPLLTSEFHYVGFWLRVLATIIDTVWLSLIILPMLFMTYGPSIFESNQLVTGWADFFISYVFPAIVVILFWHYRSATPGKMVINAEIVDANTLDKPATMQLIIRYAGYYLSSMILGLGFLWVAFDSRKQGWHDKLADTVVIKRN